jgi:hypothetical protein
MNSFPSRLSLPNDLGDLLLTPQWPGLPPSVRFGLIAIVCIVPLLLVLWLYRWELRLVSRVTALSLLGLRLVVLALLLSLICLQPVHARDKTFGLPGRVLVAVDRSDSMDVADPQRTPADKLRLARALKLIGDLAPDDQVAGWIEDYEDRRSPQWLTEEEKKLDRLKRRELETLRKQCRDVICAHVDALTRGAAARRVLGPEGVGLLSTLTAKHGVELVGFHQEAWNLRPDQLDELFRTPDGGRASSAAVSASAYTDIRRPLLRALEMAGPGQGKVLGVVLLTDGQHNYDESPVKKAAEMGDRGLPIYPIALGARRPPPDAAMVALKAPPAVFRDIDLNVEARFKVSGMTAQDFYVRLLGMDKKELGRHVYRHDGRDQERTETFKIRLDKAGTQMLVASIEPADPDAKETRTDNNSRAVIVNVADDKAKVLLIDGEARWEYHYLATALKRDRRMQLQTVVFNQPRLKELDPEEARQLGLPRQQLPAGADALAEFDCIILGDVAPEQLPLADRIRLEKYVADRGGTLVILAGKRSMPLAYAETAPGGISDPLRKLLPIEAPRVVNLKDGFPVTLTEEGRETNFMRGGVDPGAADEYWSQLPKHYWAVIGQSKPGAMPLAYLADRLPDVSPDPNSERERRQGLIVRQNYGLGRVLYVGLDSTWRWRYRAGDSYHHAFWGYAIHWAAADKALGAGNDYVRFGTARPVYRKGERPEIVVRLSEELGALRTDMLAGARILHEKGPNDEEAVALVPLTRRPARPRVLEGQAPALPPGQYALELVIPDLEQKLNSLPSTNPGVAGAKPTGPGRATFSVLPPDSTELIDLATNWTLLEELASKSGGKVFTPEDASELADLLARQTVPFVEHHEQRLWQWWVVLVLVVSLLTLEWVGRKLAGLP